MKYSYTLWYLLILAACLAVPSVVARGGRGRGGGSFGGLFGGWRSKYGSKSSSSGSGRRVVSGSPVHTAMTVPKLPPPPPAGGKAMPKLPQVASYPRQQMPPGYAYMPTLGQGLPLQPGRGGMYYANPQALPAGAVFYAQPPRGMASDYSGFLTGMLAGRMMDSLFFHQRHHVYHRNQQVEPPAATSNGREIIIINNGQSEGEVEAEQPLNESLITEQAAKDLDNQDTSSSEETAEVTAIPAPPVGGIVCFPIMLNETDPQNSELVREVERVVCFPASSMEPPPSSVDCQNDPQCIAEQIRNSGGSSTTTSSTVPPIVAGDIGGAADAAGGSLELTSYVPDVDAAHD